MPPILLDTQAWLLLVEDLPFDLAKRRKLARVVAYRRDRLARAAT